MSKKESNRNKERHSDEQKSYELIHALPKRYFELMNSGRELAKQGEFAEAAEEFAVARKEVTGIISKLLSMPKDNSAQMWQFFAILWAFKLIKSVFYWFLAKSETATTIEHQKEFLMAAVGVQRIGADMIPAFEALNHTFKGEALELLPMLGEAIRNFEHRQQVLEKTLEQLGIVFEF